MPAKRKIKEQQATEDTQNDLRTAPISDVGADLMPMAYIANNEALEGLDRLDRLARSGDRDALRMFYEITCGMVLRLNELYREHADSVLEWPILLPQDREKRNGVTKAANEMRIGSVTAGNGRPSKLAYHTEKGFSIDNLRRIDFARALVCPLAPAYADMEGNPIIPRSRAKAVFDEPEAFSQVTEIERFDQKLLDDIGNLPEYSPETRGEWVALILRMLQMNPSLIPPEIGRRSATKSTAHKPGKGLVKIITERGGRLKKTLDDGLSAVSAVPGLWGDK
jgi:hypothetical protein